jgi:hypothetical protein
MKPNVTLMVKVIIILSMLSVALNIVSSLIINNVNANIVNGVLYDYGLAPKAQWSGNNYDSYFYLTLGSVAGCAILVGLASVSSFLLVKTKNNTPRLLGYLTLGIGAAFNFISIFVFNSIDTIINGDLYGHGLLYSLQWYEPYFLQANIFLAMQIFSLAFVLISFFLLVLARPSPIRFNSQKIISLFLLVIGVSLIGLSIIYSSSNDASIFSLPTPALVGLGFIFWGMIIGYVSSEEYVKREVFDATNRAYLVTLNEMMQKLHVKGAAVFLPIKYFKGSTSNRIYLTDLKKEELGSIKKSLQKEFQMERLNDRLIVAPGNELIRLFEETLGKRFADADFAFFENSIPKMLVDELEIAQNAKIKLEGNIVKVKITNLIAPNFSKEINMQENVFHSVGTPLSSAIASALADATNKPIVINNNKIYVYENTLEIEYLLIDQRGV